MVKMVKVQLIFIVATIMQIWKVHCSCANACEIEGKPWNIMEVLPGIGWDNLQNKETSLVFEYDYANCQLTNDKKFLLPDGYFAVPEKQSNIEKVAELTDHWDNYKSLTSASINAEASYSGSAKISGKFSADYKKAKTTMYNQDSSIASAQMRYKLYTVHLLSGTNLHPLFKNRSMDIVEQMLSNNSQIADFLAELLVRDYGTHYITTVHAGAVLVQEDYISNNFLSNKQTSKIDVKAAVSADFSSKIGLSAGFNFNNSNDDSSSYQSHRVNSHIRTYGGHPYGRNFTVDEWVNSLEDNLVAIDREGVPLYFAIIPEVFTELPPSQTLELSHRIEKVIASYYKHNTRFGCTDRHDKNFYFAANIDDMSCRVAPVSFKFGGVYQICSTSDSKNNTPCKNHKQVNPLTDNYSCPNGFKPVMIINMDSSITQKKMKCHEHCLLHVWHVKIHCHQHCTTENHLISVNYKTYWCAPTNLAEDENSVLFGGIFSSGSANPLTKAKSCPTHYNTVKFGEDVQLCYSRITDPAKSYSVDFGGFESSIAGNPLAIKPYTGSIKTTIGILDMDPKDWPHSCPPGYASYYVSQEGDISYCMKVSQIIKLNIGLPSVKLPPYHKYPSFNQHSHHVASIFSVKGNLWKQDNKTRCWIKQSDSNC